MVRLKDIAEVCGVSVATVSRALNGLTNENRERTAFICQTARDMGYYPNAAARTLKTSRSNNLGILYEDRMNHEYFSSLFDELRREADAHGYDLTFLGQGGFSESNYYEHARQRNLDGVIVVQADYDAAGIIRLATSSIPTVIIDHTYDGCDCVTSDNRSSMDQIVRHVYARGHRRISFIQGEKGAVSRERLAGFYKACAELGIRVPVEYVREGHFHDPAGCTAFIRELLQMDEKPTCVLCPDDYSCLGALWLLESQGLRVPADISLVGYDGIRMSQMMTPRLTTYCQDTVQIAKEVFTLIIDAIENPETHIPKQITVSGMLMEGETVR
ncbi:MAG: LacI family DNA-binding transcriptional regulator [Clostridia bacterium]|nr:LacI family DNA-binding transcriptional regulator [Clostridia bacterium]